MQFIGIFSHIERKFTYFTNTCFGAISIQLLNSNGELYQELNAERDIDISIHKIIVVHSSVNIPYQSTSFDISARWIRDNNFTLNNGNSKQH